MPAVANKIGDFLTIEYINAQSLLGSMDEIMLLTKNRNVDVLCVSESWLLPDLLDAYVNIPGYESFRCDSGRGGGVCIYIKNVLSAKSINLSVPKQVGIEDLWVTVQCRKLPAIVIGCMYRHPKASATTFEYIQDVFKLISMKNKTFFILDDFNESLLVGNSKISKIIKTNKPIQVIDKPTRVTPTSSTLLNLIITNKPDTIYSCDVVPQEVADHDLISIAVDICKPKRSPVIRTFRHLGDYTKENFCFRVLQKTHNSNMISNTDDVNTQVDIFNANFIDCLNECAPLVTKEIKRSFAPWMNNSIREAMNIGNITRVKLKCDRHNADLLEQYKQEKKRVKTLIAECKARYYHDEFRNNKGNSSKTWKTIREIVPNSKITSNIFNFDNVVDKANELNFYFANVGKNTYTKTQEIIHGENVSYPICENETSIFERTTLSGLNL